MKRYPRSFLQLVTFGYFVVAMPLLVVAGYAFVSLDRLAEHYQVTIENVSESGRLSGELTEDVRHMEKNLRRYQVLADADALQDYEHVRTEWLKRQDAFSRLQILPAHLAQEIDAQRALETAAHRDMLSRGDFQALRTAIEELRTRTLRMHNEVQALIERDKADTRQTSKVVLQHLVVALLLALGATLCSLWAIRRLLSRLIGSFERAVLALGRNNLTAPILLEGPDDLRWLGRWLDWLRRRLRSLEEGRTQVLRHVSHELKTPLAAMREGTALLAEQVPGPLTEDQKKILGIVQSNMGRLQDLIEGLLRLQQAGHAADRIGHELLEFDHVIRQVLETQRLIAQERRISFETRLQAVQVLAGREGLLTIVHNLVSNAVKFSPPGGLVRVELKADAGQAVLDVIDQGPGIAEADRPRLFEPFFRGQAGRGVAGIGLGLAISKEFVLAHRGSIEVHAVPEGGAHFRVTIPLNAPYLKGQKSA